MLAVNTSTMYMMASKVLDSEFPFRSNQAAVLVVAYSSTTFIVQSFATSLINQTALVNSAKFNYEVLQVINLFIKRSRRRENQSLAFNVRLLLASIEMWAKRGDLSTPPSLEAKPLGPGYYAVEATVDNIITPM
jgi:hypothetical protein